MMPMERLNESDEDPRSLNDYAHDHEGGDDDADKDADLVGDCQAPMHPVPAMQSAFEESIQDVAHEPVKTDGALQNAKTRRQRLLDDQDYDATWRTRWRQRPSARCHPLSKLMAQIVFGMHLLHQKQAIDDSEVVKILQSHVDEVDDFLENTSEDFDLAIRDVEERIGLLRLPMTHLDVFDIMLDDATFRHQLIEGNTKIDEIIERTAKAMNAAFYDVRACVDSTEKLKRYMDDIARHWPKSSQAHMAIFAAMRGNEEGWRACLQDLLTKAKTLGLQLVQLGMTVGEMSKLAAAASRRSKHQDHSLARPNAPLTDLDISTNEPEPRVSPFGSTDKPLPMEPESIPVAVLSTVPKSSASPSTQHVMPLQVRQSASPTVESPHARQPATPTKLDPRSNTSAKLVPRDPCSPTKSGTRDLAEFLRDSGPLNAIATMEIAPTPHALFLVEEVSPTVMQEKAASPRLSGDSKYSSDVEHTGDVLVDTPQASSVKLDAFPTTDAPQSEMTPSANAGSHQTSSPLPTPSPATGKGSATKRASSSFKKIFHVKERA